MSKLALHIQRPTVPQWLKQFVVDAGIEHVVLMQPDLYDAPPFGDTVKYTGRLYWDNEPDKELIWRGTWGANAYWDMCYPRIAKAPWVDMWLGPCEPGFTRLEQNHEEAVYKAAAWSAFHVCGADIWHAAHLRLATAAFSTGSFQLNLAPWLYEGIDACDALTLHQYGMRTMLNPTRDHLLRHRDIREALLHWGVNKAVIITETGIDYAGNPYQDGWRAQGISGREYADQGVQYLHTLDEDAEVLYGAFFTHEHEGWPSFALDQAWSEQCLLPALRAAGDSLPEYAQQFVIPQNQAAAFYTYGRARGWEPISPEFDYGSQRAQVWYSPEDQMQHVLYCTRGDWGNIRYTDRAN